MPDHLLTFISYSRKDLAFVDRLLAALRDHDIEAWVDLDGLYAGEEYWPEICRAIEGADAFISVISPEANASKYSRRELEHAVLHHKHIVPVVFRDVDPSLLSAELARRQWVFFRDGDEPSAAGERLAAAVRVDPAWQRAHTRLLVRAREWEMRGQAGSATLRGRELREAEQWLAGADGKEVRPTSLQVDYIVASRRASTRRRQWIASSVAAALLVSAVLSWYGLSRQAGKLNNVGLIDLEEARVESALSNLNQAVKICRRIPFPPEVCRRDLPLNLGDAYYRMESYDEALRFWSEAVARESIETSDAQTADFLATAYQSMAVARIRLAEMADEDAVRQAGYARAEKEVEIVARLRASSSRDGDGPTSATTRLDITRARIHLGRGEWQQAVGLLDRARAIHSDAPEPLMLLAAAFDCAGDMSRSIEFLQRYFSKLPGGTSDRDWQLNQDYYRRMTERCKSQ